jgi:quercetin dioxygenase-like cupin family protein
MKNPEFPEFIKDLPEADLPIDAASGWILQGEDGQVLFMLFDREEHIKEHEHGDQWGIVVDGEMELTIGGKTETYRRGDSYFIPAGTPHKAIIRKGFRALDLFADRNRYRQKDVDG